MVINLNFMLETHYKFIKLLRTLFNKARYQLNKLFLRTLNYHFSKLGNNLRQILFLIFIVSNTAFEFLD
jgi:hypothetical protein